MTKSQTKNFSRVYNSGKSRADVTIRYDDQCDNGHNSFAITATIYEKRGNNRWVGSMWGSCHDEIVEAFPEFAPLIKWQSMTSNGPLHCVANTVYRASDRDYNGLAAGEKRQLRNGRTGLPCWHLQAICEDGSELPLYELSRKLIDAEAPPADTYRVEWRPVWIVGEGKERELDAARRSAIWLDANDEDLTAPGLEDRLKARLPALIAEFRGVVESLGFVF